MITIPIWALPYVFAFALMLGLAVAFWLRSNHPKVAWAIQNMLPEIAKYKNKILVVMIVIAILEFILTRR